MILRFVREVSGCSLCGGREPSVWVDENDRILVICRECAEKLEELDIIDIARED